MSGYSLSPPSNKSFGADFAGSEAGATRQALPAGRDTADTPVTESNRGAKKTV
jgi:hypothetical protein